MAWTWIPLTIAINAAGSNILQSVGTNKISDVDPCPGRNCPYSATDGVRGVNAYCGMAVAPNLGASGSLIIHGGGDADYWGNEVYAFDVSANLWSRLNNPTAAPYMNGTSSISGSVIASQSGNVLTVTGIVSVYSASGTAYLTPGQAVAIGQQVTGPGITQFTTITGFLTGTGLTGTYSVSTSATVASTTMVLGDANFDYVHGEYGDGSPGAGHNYNILQVVPGGTGGKGILLEMFGLYVYGRNAVSGWTHACDLGSGVWSRYSTNAINYSLSSAVSCYDASRGRVWVLPSGGYHSNMSYLDLTTKAHTNVTLATSLVGYNPCAAQFPVNGLLLFQTWFGSYGSPLSCGLCAVDLSNTAGGVVNLTVTGDMPPLSTTPSAGFDWDVDTNVGYFFHGNTNSDSGEMSSVYKVTPPATGSWLTGTWTFTKITLPGSVPVNSSDGVYSRWRYLTSVKKYAYVSTVTDQVTLWKP
jgi:hypothetical protein